MTKSVTREQLYVHALVVYVLVVSCVVLHFTAINVSPQTGLRDIQKLTTTATVDKIVMPNSSLVITSAAMLNLSNTTYDTDTLNPNPENSTLH